VNSAAMAAINATSTRLNAFIEIPSVCVARNVQT
jgi:hypothetical protein